MELACTLEEAAKEADFKKSSKKHGRRLYLVEIHLLLYQLDMTNPTIIYAILPPGQVCMTKFEVYTEKL